MYLSIFTVYTWVFFLCICLCTASMPGVISAGSGVTDGCEPLCWGAELGGLEW